MADLLLPIHAISSSIFIRQYKSDVTVAFRFVPWNNKPMLEKEKKETNVMQFVALRSKKKCTKKFKSWEGKANIEKDHGSLSRAIELPFTLWDRQAARLLILQQFGINMPISIVKIYWADETGITSNGNLVKGYAPAVKKRELQLNVRKENISMI